MEKDLTEIVEIKQEDIARLLLFADRKERCIIVDKAMTEFGITEDNAKAVVGMLEAMGYLQGAGTSGGRSFFGAAPYGYVLAEEGRKLVRRYLM